MLTVTLTEPQNEWVFPCWGRDKNSELVVYITSTFIGIVVIPNQNYKYQQYIENLNTDAFTPCPNPFEKKVEDKDKDIEFPCLMKSNIEKSTSIFYLRTKWSAVVLKSDCEKLVEGWLYEDSNKGVVKRILKEYNIQPFNGEITIKNG